MGYTEKAQQKPVDDLELISDSKNRTDETETAAFIDLALVDSCFFQLVPEVDSKR